MASLRDLMMADEDPEPQSSLEDELFTAVQKNDLDTATFLVTQEGVDINKTNSMSKTPLYLALENENTAMVQMLISSGADINIPSYCHMYCTYETPIVTAARLQRIDYVEMLLERKCELEGTRCMRVEGKTALQWACTFGNIDMAEVLLAHGADVNWIGMYFHTALHYATIGDKPNMVKWLLGHGAEVNINGDGRSALHIASVRGSFEIVQHLLKHKSEIDAKDNFNFTPFSLACLRGHLNIIKHMVENCDIEKANFDMDDGLLKASESGHIAVMKYLIANDADVNARNNLGETPLSLASRGQYQATLLLLENGAKIDVIDKRGYCPLQLALLRDQIDIATMLINHGASVTTRNDNTEHPLKLAFSLSNPLLLKYIVLTSCHLQQAPWFDTQAIKEKLQEADFQRQAPLRFAWETRVQKDIWAWLLATLNKPKSLSSLSRIAIRDQLTVASGGSSILARSKRLPLPKALIKYIQLEDILNE